MAIEGGHDRIPTSFPRDGGRAGITPASIAYGAGKLTAWRPTDASNPRGHASDTLGGSPEKSSSPKRGRANLRARGALGVGVTGEEVRAHELEAE